MQGAAVEEERQGLPGQLESMGEGGGAVDIGSQPKELPKPYFPPL